MTEETQRKIKCYVSRIPRFPAFWRKGIGSSTVACEQAFCLGKNSEEREGKGGGENFSLFPLSTPLDQRPNNSHLRAWFTCGLSHLVITRFEELGGCSISGWGGGGGAVMRGRKSVLVSLSYRENQESMGNL